MRPVDSLLVVGMHAAAQRRAAMLGFALALSFACSAAEAQSRWDICNITDERLTVAIAFPNGEAIQSRGWFALERGACQTFNFKQIFREVHLRAQSGTKLYPPANGNVQLCANRRGAFDLADARPWRSNCGRTFDVEHFYTLPFTGNHTVTRISSGMGAPPPRKHQIDPG